MKKILIIILIIFLFENVGNEIYRNNHLFIETSNIVLNGDSNDSAHFKYYENSSHIKNWYEWWYFNIIGKNQSILLYYFTFGNLNGVNSMVGTMAAIFKENETIKSIISYPFINYSLDYKKCNISIGGNRIYEEDGKYFIYYKSKDFELSANIKNEGKSFGGEATKIKKWQWMSWYVAVPFGKANGSISLKGKKYFFSGRAYHDHNWGIAKPYLKWDWGEFNTEKFAIIYGMVMNNGTKGGLYYVNKSNFIFIPYGKIKIFYEKWKMINGYLKPSKIHIYSDDKKINLNIELEKYYMIGFGKPYLFGIMYGKFYNEYINATGFYEHHGLFIK